MFAGIALVNQCNGESCPNCAYFLFFLVIYDSRVESELVLSSDIMAETLTHHAAQMQAERAALVAVVKKAQKGRHVTCKRLAVHCHFVCVRLVLHNALEETILQSLAPEHPPPPQANVSLDVRGQILSELYENHVRVVAFIYIFTKVFFRNMGGGACNAPHGLDKTQFTFLALSRRKRLPPDTGAWPACGTRLEVVGVPHQGGNLFAGIAFDRQGRTSCSRLYTQMTTVWLHAEITRSGNHRLAFCQIGRSGYRHAHADGGRPVVAGRVHRPPRGPWRKADLLDATSIRVAGTLLHVPPVCVGHALLYIYIVSK